jgi:hypothetical protein
MNPETIYIINAVFILMVPISIIATVIICTINQRKRKKLRNEYDNSIQPGTILSVTISHENPFLEDEIFKIKVLERKNNWVKYAEMVPYSDNLFDINKPKYDTIDGLEYTGYKIES